MGAVGKVRAISRTTDCGIIKVRRILASQKSAPASSNVRPADTEGGDGSIR